MAGRNASIRDVAAMAGVSHQTVSRVLNAPGSVRESTRRTVEEAMAKLGYRPNVAARALRSQRSRVVGVLVAPNSLFVALNGLSHLERALRARGLRLLMAGLQGANFPAMVSSVEPLLEFGVDALVIAANERSAADLARDLARRMPVVALQPGAGEEDGVSSAAVDFDVGVRAVVQHLVARGDRHLLLVPGPRHHTTMAARVTAWTREVAAAALQARIHDPVEMTVDGGYGVGRRLAEEGLPHAVFAVNDLVAMGMLRAFHERGVRVPEDVAVVGVDDLFGSWFTIPSLSTVAQNFDAVGAVAGELVAEALEGEAPRTVRIEPELIVRESSSGRRAG